MALTELEWQSRRDPKRMLDHLLRWPTGDLSGREHAHPHHPGRRKLLYLISAMEQSWWGGEGSAATRRSLILLEAIAEGRAPFSRLDEVALSIDTGGDAEEIALRFVTQHNSGDDPSLWADLIREVVGNPWRRLLGPDNALEIIRGRYVCEDCGIGSESGHALGVVQERRCSRCRSHRVRKLRRGDDARLVVLERPWLTPDVKALAEACWAGSSPGSPSPLDLPAALADALERAGACDPPCPNCQLGDGRVPFYADCPSCLGHGTLPVLRHLREPGPHPRGCFVLDAIRGKS